MITNWKCYNINIDAFFLKKVEHHYFFEEYDRSNIFQNHCNNIFCKNANQHFFENVSFFKQDQHFSFFFNPMATGVRLPEPTMIAPSLGGGALVGHSLDSVGWCDTDWPWLQ
jgi:hypothetical protein